MSTVSGIVKTFADKITKNIGVLFHNFYWDIRAL